MNDEQPLRLSFGQVAEAYHRGRPTYTEETARWLLGQSAEGTDEPLDVLEIGAGTGKLTRELVALGHRVHACDPDEGMLDVLARVVPEARTAQASAEDLPYADRTFDVVVVAQAFHWFDHSQALPEIARVLRSTGRVALVWHERDTKIPWVRRLGGVLGDQDTRGVSDTEVEPLIASRFFGVVEDATFKHWQHIDREVVVDLALSRSNVASLPAELRATKTDEVLAFYDGFGRGMDGMQLPYLARCFRARVIERAQPTSAAGAAGRTATEEGGEATEPLAVHDLPDADRPAGATAGEAGSTQDAETRAARSAEIFSSDGTDTDMLLIDFR